MAHIWQSKKVLKTGKSWKKPAHLKVKPKDMSHEDWKNELKFFKAEKNLVLGNITKTKKIITGEEDDE